ncbi:MAG: pol polyprotein, partial [Candidatus Thiodiazotropha endolucinida]|nr:retroviral-like aspartic protease family protein [Candidatus Thiodiazotropha taylori]MCW4259812.1 pol polyprotein [Candidatus Thiodiazotropha endolucinida]
MAGSPNSCIIKIGQQRIRSLVDSGASVSLLHRKIYDRLKPQPKISKNVPVNLQGVNGATLSVDGSVDLGIKLGGEKINQKFYVVNNINRNAILGLDFLTDKGVRLYYDLSCFKIGKSFIPFEQDLQIASLVRLTKAQIIKPQTCCLCTGKIKTRADLPPNMYQICEVNRGFLSSEPGLTLTDSVVNIGNDRSLPVMITNTTNKTYRLRRGCVVGQASCLSSENLVSMSSHVNEVSQPSEADLLADVNVPPEYEDRVNKLICKNVDIFAQKDTQLGQTETLLFSVDTGNAKPIKLRPYRTPFNDRKILDKAIDEMLEAKIIERSNSPWSFPCILVKKKDNSHRFCVDFRQLNKVTKSNSFPLPVIDDILAQLGGAKYYSSLDLKSGYWQMKVNPRDKEKVAFTCHRGLFQFRTMPFGVLNGPAKFQELMTIVLGDCNDFAVPYMDDIIIFSPTLEKHFEHIQTVFNRLRQHNLKLKLKKCTFLQTETNYLGFLISKNGIKPDPEKVKSIRALPEPKCVKDVRSFIRLCSYYRRFIPSFSAIAEPLIKLTRKYSKFTWGQDAQQAFDQLKADLTAIPMLGYPDLSKNYILYTDASNDCVGAVLVQPCDEKDSILPNVPNEKPIYFLSHKLSASQQKWSVIEKEAFAIKYALEKLDCFLHGSKFIIRCDHEPLMHIINKSSVSNNKKLATWSLHISSYDCELQYIRGITNTCSDMLSRIIKKKKKADTG